MFCLEFNFACNIFFFLCVYFHIFLFKVDNTKQLEQLREDLNKVISEDIPVLVIPIKTESENTPGMLPEEKVFLYIVCNIFFLYN